MSLKSGDLTSFYKIDKVLGEGKRLSFLYFYSSSKELLDALG